MAPGDPCALIIIDLDDFKRVNDTFGHKAGDQVIHRTGQMLSSLFRASDIVGRLGGDEFAVFLSGSEVDEELMRRKGAEICDELQIVLGDGPAMSLTASAGIYLSEGPQDFDGLYQAADLALYKAKKDGKHRWCIKARGSYKNSTGLAVGAIGMTELLENLDCGIAIMELSEPIRVWSAGCSTGEEAYSVAILFREVMEELQVQRDVKIFATDVDSRAIEQAGRGFFSENIVDDVTPDRLARFFIKQNEGYQVSKDIRRMIVFATHNMFSDPPFGKLDMIICRNVMIYFQPVLRRGLFAIFHSALKNNGFLFLGKNETSGEYVNLFQACVRCRENLCAQG